MDINCSACERLLRYAKGEEKLRVVYESEYSIAFYPPKPFAEVHIAVMTKKHIPTIFDLTEVEISVDIMKAIKVASKEIISLKGACKLEMYLGEWQNTKHFHCHVIYDSSVS